jgi:hypothetical protein
MGQAQALFAPQACARKPAQKQPATGGFSNDHRPVHRVSTALSTAGADNSAADERTSSALQFYDIVIQRRR